MEILGDAMMASIVKPSDDEGGGVEETSTGRNAVESIIATLKKHERMIEERRRRERSRYSEERTAESADGTSWTYVVVDGEHLRIGGCATSCEILEIPAEIDSMPVLELGVQACANLGSVREIVCADSIEVIDANAFRGCPQLRRLTLPQNITRFDATWIAQCRKLTELVCPAMLTVLDAGVFDTESLELLVLGIATRDIEPGAFAKSRLRELRIPEQNPYLATDGRCVFSKDGSELIAIGVPCTGFALAQGCRRIASKAFAACPDLESVVFPDTLEEIGTHAFARTALRSFVSPPGLKRIERRAFYRCRKLEEVDLNEGLLAIGDEAFAGTALSQAQLPASLEELSQSAFAQTKLSFYAGSGTCSIVPGGKLHFDRHGVLYRESGGDRGKELICAMGCVPARYQVEAGTCAIAPGAFARCADLFEVALCEGLAEIGEGAFRACKNLAHARFPESLRSVDDEAFLNTSLEEVYIPSQLAHLGRLALVTQGAYDDDAVPTLHTVQVSLGNERFYSTGGMLCERMGEKGVRIVLFDDSRESVRLPAEVTDIADYAFSGARNLHELFMSTRVTHVGAKGLNVDCLVEHVHVDLDVPIEGHMEIDLHFPNTLRSVRELARGFNTTAFISVEKLLARYDACVVNMHDYDAKNSGPVDLYGQVTRIIERLRDPLYLTENTHSMYKRIIRDNLEDMCVAIARHDDRAAIDGLVELGFLTRESILGVIEAVGRLQDAAMTGYLLEIQRRISATGAIDFDL